MGRASDFRRARRPALRRAGGRDPPRDYALRPTPLRARRAACIRFLARRPPPAAPHRSGFTVGLNAELTEFFEAKFDCKPALRRRWTRRDSAASELRGEVIELGLVARFIADGNRRGFAISP